MNDTPTTHEPSPEVRAALGPLMKAVSDFALAASAQFGSINPDAYAAMTADHKRGLIVPIVQVELSTTNPCAQLAMDVGLERRIVLSIPMSNGEPPRPAVIA